MNDLAPLENRFNNFFDVFQARDWLHRYDQPLSVAEWRDPLNEMNNKRLVPAIIKMSELSSKTSDSTTHFETHYLPGDLLHGNFPSEAPATCEHDLLDILNKDEETIVLTTTLADNLVCPVCKETIQNPFPGQPINWHLQICWACHHYTCEKCTSIKGPSSFHVGKDQQAPSPLNLGSCYHCKAPIGPLSAPMRVKLDIGFRNIVDMGDVHLLPRWAAAFAVIREVDEVSIQGQSLIGNGALYEEGFAFLTRAIMCFNFIEEMDPNLMYGVFSSSYFRLCFLRWTLEAHYNRGMAKCKGEVQEFWKEDDLEKRKEMVPKVMYDEEGDKEPQKQFISLRPTAFSHPVSFLCSLIPPPTGPADVLQQHFLPLYLDQNSLPDGSQLIRDDRLARHIFCSCCTGNPRMRQLGILHRGQVTWMGTPNLIMQRFIDVRWVFMTEQGAKQFLKESWNTISEKQKKVRGAPSIGTDCQCVGGVNSTQTDNVSTTSYSFIYRMGRVVVKVFGARGIKAEGDFNPQFLATFAKIASVKVALWKPPADDVFKAIQAQMEEDAKVAAGIEGKARRSGARKIFDSAAEGGMDVVQLSEPTPTAQVQFQTSKGIIEIELWTKECPKACRNFLHHCASGYYDDTIFHRVVKDFCIQGGDPTGVGDGGESIYGGPFPIELHQRLRFSHRGILAMATSTDENGIPDVNDNRSQFFITLAPCEWLNKKHTIFGRVTPQTIYTVVAIGEVDTDADDRPYDPPKLTRADILANPFDDMADIVRISKSNDDELNEQDRSRFGINKKTPPVPAVRDKRFLSFGDEDEHEDDDTPGTAFKMMSVFEATNPKKQKDKKKRKNKEKVKPTTTDDRTDLVQQTGHADEEPETAHSKPIVAYQPFLEREEKAKHDQLMQETLAEKAEQALAEQPLFASLRGEARKTKEKPQIDEDILSSINDEYKTGFVRTGKKKAEVGLDKLRIKKRSGREGDDAGLGGGGAELNALFRAAENVVDRNMDERSQKQQRDRAVKTLLKTQQRSNLDVLSRFDTLLGKSIWKGRGSEEETDPIKKHKRTHSERDGQRKNSEKVASLSLLADYDDNQSDSGEDDSHQVAPGPQPQTDESPAEISQMEKINRFLDLEDADDFDANDMSWLHRSLTFKKHTSDLYETTEELGKRAMEIRTGQRDDGGLMVIDERRKGGRGKERELEYQRSRQGQAEKVKDRNKVWEELRGKKD
ncbi:putative Peptidyl-prolyl cis-trans isomerase CYP57 [Blattamonas nauphoetae]|uniref:Peptidyl-prolyl cis-trans isomerase CYP57 n=1 Tax=Blattamonas nauphoetae TaxID=2049346 RepID=A0ABQ9XXU8_9EUKA|nr:putative Peptidyl-prolyl cis-trans isomerase CYP57 [Blattamonas nauphoetae]